MYWSTPLFSLALAVLIYAVYRTTRFLARNAPAGQSLLHPIQGFVLWTRLVRANAFGPAAEPERRGIVRLYLLALLAYGLAVAGVVVSLNTGPPA